MSSTPAHLPRDPQPAPAASAPQGVSQGVVKPKPKPKPSKVQVVNPPRPAFDLWALRVRRALSRLGLAVPPVRMVALDLDGTLLDSRKRISSQTVKVLRALPEVGVRVVIASARPPRSCRAIYEGLGLDTWQINYNGALIWDPAQKRPVRHYPLKGPLVWEMCKLARELVPSVQVAAEVVDRWYTDSDEAYRTTVTNKLFRPDVVAPMASWGKQPTTKLMFLAEPRKVARIREGLRAKFGKRAKVVHADPDLVQVMSNDAGKDVALRAVCEHHGIDPRDTLAIGDAANDLDMLAAAGVGVAVANGCDECKQVARWVAPSNDDHGVYEAVRKFVPKVNPIIGE